MITMDEYILNRVLALLIERETGLAFDEAVTDKIGEAVGLLASGLYIDEAIWREDASLSPMIGKAIAEYNERYP